MITAIEYPREQISGVRRRARKTVSTLRRTLATVPAIVALWSALCLVPTCVLGQERAVAKPAKAVTPPAKVQRPIPPLPSGRRILARFKAAPFPYDGLVPATGKPFLDVEIEGRLGRQSPRAPGQVYWADETYRDDRVLLDLPAGFSPSRPAVLVIYLHGNGAILQRDVINRQMIPQQIAGAGLNSALIAPQLARDAADSSAGKFWEPRALTAFLDEAADQLAKLAGAARAKPLFDAMPVVLVAYSGGYFPLASLLEQGGSAARIAGVVVLDGLYGEHTKFADWISARRTAFFFAAFGPSSAEGTAELARLLSQRNIPVASTLSPLLGPLLSSGGVTLLEVPATAEHADFASKAWVDLPLRDFMRRIPGYRRQTVR